MLKTGLSLPTRKVLKNLGIVAMIILAVILFVRPRRLVTGKTLPPDHGPQVAFLAKNNIYVYDHDSRKFIQLTQSRGHINEAVWSPDGRYLIFREYNDKEDSGILYRLDVTSADILRLTPINGPDCWGLAWSLDGRSVACHTSTEASVNDIFLVQPDGSGMNFLTNGAYPSWSADSQRLIYTTDQGITAIDLQNGETSLLLALDEFAWFPKWSPDGQMVAYAATDDFSSGLFSINIWDGESVTVVVENVIRAESYQYTWKSDGAALRISNFEYDLAGGETRPRTVGLPVYSPDGLQWFDVGITNEICLFPAPLVADENNCTKSPGNLYDIHAVNWRP